MVRRILELEFLEMAEVSLDPDPVSVPGRPPPPGRLPITDISQWLERYSLMAVGYLGHSLPRESAGAVSMIIRAERNYEAGRWVAYDRQFRRAALARRDLDWSVSDPRLYNEAFTGRARAIPRCHFCLQDDHTSRSCPRNPEQPWLGWYPQSPWPSSPAGHTGHAGPASRQSADVCRRYNEGRCRHPRCRYTHSCMDCGAQHPSISCPSQWIAWPTTVEVPHPFP